MVKKEEGEETELTPNGIRELVIDSNPKKLVVQFLEMKLIEKGKRAAIVISDGFAKKTGILVSEAERKVLGLNPEPLQKHDVITTNCFYHPVSKMIIILSFEVLMTGINGQIGNPMIYEDFVKAGFINPEGWNQIFSPQPPSKPKIAVSPPKAEIKMIKTENSQDSTMAFSVSKQRPQVQQNAPDNFQTQSQGFPAAFSDKMGKTTLKPKVPEESSQKSTKELQPVIRCNTNFENEVTQIGALTLYSENWVIKARVILKSKMRDWTNEKSKGRFFKIVLADESGKIQASFFNSSVDKFFPIIVEDGVYMFSDGKLKPNYGKFNTTKHDYEISFDENSKILRLRDDGTIGTGLNLLTIEQIKKANSGELVDLAGIIADEGSCENFQSKGGDTRHKRSIWLVDEGMEKMEVVLWGGMAEDETSFHKGKIVAFRQVRVGIYAGITNLSFVVDSQVILDPKREGRIVTLHHLRALPNFNLGQVSSAKERQYSVIFFQNFAEMEKAVSMMGSDPDEKQYFTCLASCSKIKTDNLYYPSCMTEGCFKKVMMTGMGWVCNSCNVTIDRPLYRYIGTVMLVDSYRPLWCKINGNSGKTLFGCEANALQELKERDDQLFLDEVYKYCGKVRRFTILVKNEKFGGGEIRKSFTIMNICDDPSRENKTLLNMLEAYYNLSQ